MPELSEWNSFYVIVGSSAGALVGLQFVVITLISDKTQIREPAAADAFATPSVVHFAIVLVLSAVLSAPWRGVAGIAVFAALVGVAGIIYTLIVARRVRMQKAYKPVFEDWAFHALLPLIAYGTVALSAFVVTQHTRRALFFLGSATLLFLFVGIHNAWDSVTYAVFASRRGDGPTE